MEMQRIEEKCTLCMLCVRDCVAGVWQEEDGVPVAVRPETCNRCSHCLSVCPQGAIVHDALDPSQIRRVLKKRINPDSYREIVISRRSVRQYKQRPVSSETIEDIINLARYSPTASNSQHVEYIVITDKELLEKISKKIFGTGTGFYKKAGTAFGRKMLKAVEKTHFGQTLERYMDSMDLFIEQATAGRDLVLHHAPALILIHAPGRAGFACDNCNIAAANISNYAHALGLGTCYIGFLTLFLRFDRSLGKQLGIPQGRRVYVSLIMGYPAYAHSHTASRKKPKIKWIQ